MKRWSLSRCRAPKYKCTYVWCFIDIPLLRSFGCWWWDVSTNRTLRCSLGLFTATL